jgi:hypothetical protein
MPGDGKLTCTRHCSISSTSIIESLKGLQLNAPEITPCMKDMIKPRRSGDKARRSREITSDAIE